MKIRIVFVLCFLFPGFVSFSQAGRPLGCFREKSSYEQVERIPRSENSKGGIILESVSWKRFAPEVGDQGYEINSCVGWATTYLMTMEEAMDMGPDQSDPVCLEELKFSASYLYNKVKVNDNCSSGAYLTDALDFAMANGICRHADFPNSKERCDGPAPEKDARLPKYRSRGYKKLFDGSESKKSKTLEVKRMLSSGKPVLVALEVTDSFFENSGKEWAPEMSEKRNVMLHTVVVVGYDNLYFEMLNSFGKGWKNKGFFYMTYENFAEYVCYAFVVCQNDNKECKGKGGDWGKEKLYAFSALEKLQADGSYKAVEVWKDSLCIYQINEDALTVDDWFQIAIKEIPEEVYVYIINIPASGLPALLGELRPDTGLKDNYIVKDFYLDAGREQLIFLFSRKPIDNVVGKVNALKGCKGKILEKLKCAFEIDYNYVHNSFYSEGKLLAVAKPNDGIPAILPLILNINVRK